MKKFSEFTTETRRLNEQSELQEKYQAFFTALLKKYEVTSPAQLDKEKMSEFFNEIKNNWERGSGVKAEGQKIMDEFGK